MKTTLKLIITIMLLLPLYPISGGAVEPDEVLSDPVLEQRARIISKDLRCLVCQNQSIDDSDATLAKDLRVLVRERLTQGETNEQVIDYIVSRYGEYVLLNPRFNAATLFLWIGPLVFLLLGAVGVFFFLRRQTVLIDPEATGQLKTSAPPLSEDDETRIKTLLEDGEK